MFKFLHGAVRENGTFRSCENLRNYEEMAFLLEAVGGECYNITELSTGVLNVRKGSVNEKVVRPYEKAI